MKKLVLASQSPSRYWILNNLGVKFEVCPSNYKEDMSLSLSPEDLAIHLSRGKAKDVAKKYSNAVIVAADSFALFQGRLLGKPHSLAKARAMLKALSNNTHTFITGFTLIDTTTGQEISDSCQTVVHFRYLSTQAIDDYLDSEDVLGYAGAYKIQGKGRLLVDKIDGDFYNVVGLPISNIAPHLKRFGIDLFS